MAKQETIIEVGFDPNDDECQIQSESRHPDMTGGDFLFAWLEDRSKVPSGFFYYKDEYGLYVAIDNKTGSGHMKAFDSREDCLNWLELMEFLHKRNQRQDRKPVFGSDSWNAKTTVRAGYKDLRQICTEHGWLNACSIEDMTKIMMANDCGWPLDHIATMIWMGTDYRKDSGEWIGFGNAGAQREEILTVLTQYRDRMLYNDKRCEKIDQLEEAGINIISQQKETEAEAKTTPVQPRQTPRLKR